MTAITQQQLWAKLESVARIWATAGTTCTPSQLQACEAAFIRLLEESWDEQALVIFNALVPLAKTSEDPWRWLTAELLFEAYAIALDDRQEAARHYLQLSPALTDETLDTYNERICRFADLINSPITG